MPTSRPWAHSGWQGWQNWEPSNPAIRSHGSNPPFADTSHHMPGPSLQRGYMRAIDTDTFGGQRLYFQYNPNTIERTTEPNAEVYNPLVSDPAELSIPVRAFAQFSFSLLFNRQAEVAADEFTMASQSFTADAYKGVNVDLGVFDRVAGIGQTYTGSGDTVKPLVNTAPGLQGNGVLMEPMRPVRVVFSHQLMVEGYIDRAVVSWTKFNVAMVPVWMGLAVSMKAGYIGMARDTTSFSELVQNGQFAQAVKDAWGNRGSASTEIGAGGNPSQNVTGRVPPSDQTYGVTPGMYGSGGSILNGTNPINVDSRFGNTNQNGWVPSS